MRTRRMMRAPDPPGYLEWKLDSACPVCGERKLLERFDRDKTLGYRWGPPYPLHPLHPLHPLQGAFERAESRP